MTESSPAGLLPSGPEAQGETDQAPPDHDESSDGSGDSPLEEFLGVPTDPFDLSEAYQIVYVTWADEITYCMTEQGFDYVEEVPEFPPPEDFVSVGGGGEGDALELGYGVAGSLRLSWESQGNEPPPMEESLNESEMRALAQAWSACSQEAYARTPLPDALPVQLLDLLEPLEEAIRTAPEATAVWGEWARCMAASGYDFASRSEAVAAVSERAGLIDLRLESELQRDEIEARIAEVERFESDVVAADRACSVQLNLSARLAAVRSRLEREFIDQEGDRIVLLLGETSAADD